MKKYSCNSCKVPLVVNSGLGLVGESTQNPWVMPARLSRYIIEKEIARGGMGIVYKGRQEGLDRCVAIKVLLPTFANNEDIIKRFQREARAAAKLKHPNIVAIHEVGDYNGIPFFTMDFIEGSSLGALIDDRRLTMKEGVRIIRDVAKAVHYAHAQGIIHRDLKPDNILVEKNGTPKLTDFGIAKDLYAQSMISMTGDIMGTPAFMAPEQADGRVHDIDRRTDVYALGAILYKILTQRPPFTGDSIVGIIYNVVNEQASPPEKFNAQIPTDLSAIVCKAIEKEPKRRYQTALELAEDCDRWLKGEPVRARPLSKVGMITRRIKKHRKSVAVIAGITVVFVGILAAVLVFGGKREISIIEENLKSPDASIKLNAANALSAFLEKHPDDKRARELMVGVSAESEPVLRGTALTFLEKNSIDESFKAQIFPSLVRGLKTEQPESLWCRSAAILASAKYSDAAVPISDHLRSPSRDIRLAAIKALKQMPTAAVYRDVGVMLVVERDDEIRSIARDTMNSFYVNNIIAAINPQAAAVGRALSDLSKTVNAYNQQIENAMNTPQSSIDSRVQLLKSGDMSAKIQAAYELGNSGDKKNCDALIEAIENSEADVAVVAGDGLAKLGAAPYKEKLLKLLAHEKTSVRMAAAVALSGIREEDVHKALKQAHASEGDKWAEDVMLGVLEKFSKK